jgi:hypothetical protein
MYSRMNPRRSKALPWASRRAVTTASSHGGLRGAA